MKELKNASTKTTTDLKNEVLNILNNFNSKTINPYQEFTPATRYITSIINVLKSENLNNISEYFQNLYLLLSQKNIPLFTLDQHPKLYRQSQKNPDLFKQLIYLHKKIKSKKLNESIWQHMFSSFIPNKINNTNLYAHFYLLSKFVNSGIYIDLNQTESKKVLNSIFNIRFKSHDINRSQLGMERVFNKKYKTLFCWIKNLGVSKEQNSKYLKAIDRLLIINSEQYNQEDFFTKQESIEIGMKLRKNFPLSTILDSKHTVLERFINLFECATDFFERQSFYETDKSEDANYILNRYFQDYKVSGSFIVNMFNMTPKENQWFVNLLNGYPLHKNTDMPFTLTKKAAHIFHTIPYPSKYYPDGQYIRHNTSLKYSVTEALIYSIFLSKEVPTHYANLVIKNKAVITHQNLDYWIKWMSYLYHNGLQRDHIETVMDYLHFKVFVQKCDIRLKGKKVHNLLLDVEKWHEELQSDMFLKRYKEQSLVSSGIDEFEYQDNTGIYTIKQILSVKELFLEGKNLHHCVFSYRTQCLRASAFIFSLRRIEAEVFETRLITIEVRNGSIVQAKGSHNKRTNKKEREIIRIWATEKELDLRIA